MSTGTTESTTPGICICAHDHVAHGGQEMACIGINCSCRSYYPAKLASTPRQRRFEKLKKRIDDLLQWTLVVLCTAALASWTTWYVMQELGL